MARWALWIVKAFAELQVPEDECAESGCAAVWLQRRAQHVAEENVSWGWSGKSKEDEDTEEIPLGTCYRDTGGTCRFFSCAASRGEATCESRRCKCKPGFCNHHGSCVLESEANRCIRDTEKTCHFFGCASMLGNATCESGHCVCAPGYCQINGLCYRKQGILHARVVPINKEKPQFPHHVETALAFSGGGGRAFAFSLGVLRALEHLGLMRYVDGISSVSGGSWAASVYMFSTLPVNHLLGASTKPSELTLANLEKPESALGTVGAVSSMAIAKKLVKAGIEPQELWVNTISKAILEPFGLHDLDSYMAADQASVREIRQRNPHLKDAKFLTPAPGRPKMFVMSGALLGPTGYKATKDNVVSLQMSPDFVGSPFYPNDEPSLVGGGFVESFAFGGLGGQQCWGFLRLDAGSFPWHFKSSQTEPQARTCCFVARLSCTDTKHSRSDYWAIPSPRFDKQQSASTYLLGDGGNIDNSGLLALLQRRARRIILVVSSGSALPDDVDFCTVPSLSPDVAKRLENQLQANFGFWKEDDIGEFLTRNQVFRKDQLLPLLCQLQSLKKLGKPTVAKRKLKVLANSWWGIDGGFDVELLVVYLDKCKDFESSQTTPPTI
eukprot:symbB.v1.2.005099.t1/scaffold234.1/size257806/18